ncbi:type 1 fimbrial protein [Providencia rettgeri]
MKIKLLVFVTLLLQVNVVLSQELHTINDVHGSVNIGGSIIESGCTIDMASKWQEISLGEIESYKLKKVGDHADSIPFTIFFRNCMRASDVVYDPILGISTWSTIEPIVTVSFVSKSDLHDPSMMGVSGVSGVALKLTDEFNNKIYFGETKGRPQFIKYPQGSLVYHITPVRTSEVLSKGSFRAVLDFKVNYD